METEVTYRLGNGALQRLCGLAEARCCGNLRRFGADTVLVEGGGYEKVWLETQPMGGEMYAKRNLAVGLANQRIFMAHQRADGRLPGSVKLEGGVPVPEYNKLQGFCFPAPALNLYYLCGGDKAYLLRLRDCLAAFDAYLWRTRACRDGVLCSWCVCDTGEDHALRYGDAPFWWEGETPPEGYRSVPMRSMDVTAYSFAARSALADIGVLLADGSAAGWRRGAQAVRERIGAYFWNGERGACFDRGPDATPQTTLCHNTLRLMYWGALTPGQARRFVREHLLNPDEFYTPMPLPSVAANDPLFRNVPANDWSGQPEGLTYQRAIRALENYGFLKEITLLGRKLFAALLGAGGVFPQQFDPFTGAASPTENGDYGPTALALLEYVSRLYGVHIERREVYFGLLGGMPVTYEQRWGRRRYRLESDGAHARIFVNGAPRWGSPCGVRLVTDWDGALLRAEAIDPDGPETAGPGSITDLGGGL